MVLGAIFVPSFSSFSYYFMLDEVQLSKFTYSMLTVIAFFCLLLGSQISNSCFKDTEYRKLIIVDALISICIAPLTFIFVCRWNLEWGISDMFFIITTDVVAEIIT